MPETLAIDIGNSRIKYGIFRDSVLLEKTAALQENRDILETLAAKYNIGKLILSAVRDFDAEAFYLPDTALFQLDSSLKSTATNAYWTMIGPAPIHIEYEEGSPGNDRVAACAGARRLFEENDILVVTAGTCITYNLLQGMSFKGGSISPGLNMRYQALEHFTGKLPLLKPAEHERLTGRTTADAIRSGVQIGLMTEIDGIIQLYRDTYPGIKAVISGGDSSFLQKRLKSGIFAQDDLELYGLNYILNKHVH